jgi:pimeloyl-ACP methyl ester carboxylesterase
MPHVTPPHFPIIYVRGYAGSEELVEETVATPYMGFNLGSTKVRRRWTGDTTRHVFESPLVRLMKDHGYGDVYEGGAELPASGPMPAKSIVIYRYYDQVSESLDTGTRPDMEVYAEGLSGLIDRVRDQVCGDDAAAREAFRVYLVAHSMGGLICRAFPSARTIGTTRSPPAGPVAWSVR